MTHDELLAKINEPDHWFKPFLDIRQALRAVVKLHYPKSTGVGFTDLLCAECSGLDANDYPCATIQAIEKELQ
jgi:hypothetical protein